MYGGLLSAEIHPNHVSLNEGNSKPRFTKYRKSPFLGPKKAYLYWKCILDPLLCGNSFESLSTLSLVEILPNFLDFLTLIEDFLI